MTFIFSGSLAAVEVCQSGAPLSSSLVVAFLHGFRLGVLIRSGEKSLGLPSQSATPPLGRKSPVTSAGSLEIDRWRVSRAAAAPGECHPCRPHILLPMK